MVTDAGNQGQLPWLATLVTKVTTMVTTMVTMMVTTMVTTMVTITNLGYRGCVTDYYILILTYIYIYYLYCISIYFQIDMTDKYMQRIFSQANGIE